MSSRLHTAPASSLLSALAYSPSFYLRRGGFLDCMVGFDGNRFLINVDVTASAITIAFYRYGFLSTQPEDVEKAVTLLSKVTLAHNEVIRTCPDSSSHYAYVDGYSFSIQLGGITLLFHELNDYQNSCIAVFKDDELLQSIVVDLRI